MKNVRFLLILVLIALLIIYFRQNRKYSDFDRTEEKDFATYTPLEVKDFGFAEYLKEKDNVSLTQYRPKDLHELETTEIVIPELKNIIELLRLGKYDELEEYLKELESRNDPGLLPWIMYYKGHIMFLKKKYSSSRRIFRKFMDEFPSHEMSTNVKEALKFLGSFYE